MYAAMIALMAAFGGPVNPIPLTASPGEYYDEVTDASVNITVSVNPDGTVTVTSNGEAPLSVTVNFYLPTTTGIGNSYYVKFTPTLVTASVTGITNNASTFTQISVARTCVLNVNGVIASHYKVYDVLIEIASDSGGTTVVASRTVRLHVVASNTGGG